MMETRRRGGGPKPPVNLTGEERETLERYAGGRAVSQVYATLRKFKPLVCRIPKRGGMGAEARRSAQQAEHQSPHRQTIMGTVTRVGELFNEPRGQDTSADVAVAQRLGTF
jgi:hypothetical protein